VPLAAGADALALVAGSADPATADADPVADADADAAAEVLAELSALFELELQADRPTRAASARAPAASRLLGPVAGAFGRPVLRMKLRSRAPCGRPE
jgi:hypothetical protein